MLKVQIQRKYKELLTLYPNLFSADERALLKGILKDFYSKDENSKRQEALSVSKQLDVIRILLNEMSLGKTAILSFLLQDLVTTGYISLLEIKKNFGISLDSIIQGLANVNDLYKKDTSLETENFRKLLLTFAQDLRVILIILAERLHTMRNLQEYDKEQQQNIARECVFLYAPLAHRMGLYAIKSELEDLSLKYTNSAIYKEIAKKLNETKRSRDQYIAEFIAPLKEKIKSIGADFEIKGRTKSIHSIYSKIKKQNTPFENIYDLFAIRIIINAPLEKEKALCWQTYSIVTDMYQPNPKRMRDWISIPKSNGYECLHTTVLGPDGKWVEVQIRTVRMDEVAEKGLAAHWKYKGIKSESGMDEWLKNVREILENPELNAVDFMDEFKLNLYDKEVFVFTPNGDLHRLPKGATVLDFAFSIHSELGCKCSGAKVNNRNVPIKYALKNGDQVEILTAPNQKPHHDWLNIVSTSKAKNKIRQALKEVDYKDAEHGREILVRRFKNWKIELDDGNLSRVARKKNYKTVSDLYQDIAHGKLDMHAVRELYSQLDKKETTTEAEIRSADSFVKEAEQIEGKEDVLIIGENLKNIEFKLAKCCKPIYGDEVFGFVSITGGIKVHRTDCPNAPEMISRYGYRIIKTRWSGKSVGSLYPITLRIVGHDDISIVANITSLISKEKDVLLRSISIDTNAGLFQGNITIMIHDTKQLESVIKKIKTVKGVKNVERS